MKISGNKLYFLLALCTGILLWLAWPPHGQGWVSLTAFVPMLFLVRQIEADRPAHSRRLLFIYSYIAFVIWNLLCTFWIRNASMFGAIAASCIVNGILMPMPMLAYQWLRKKLSPAWDALAFVAPWISFEFFHHNWDLSWPWLTLGNAFASNTDWIQWYEYTGALGGSCWILLVNYLLFQLLAPQTAFSTRRKLSLIALCIASILVPYVVSLTIKSTFSLPQSQSMQVVVVQPNEDPYSEKFSGNPIQQLEHMLKQAEAITDSNTQLLVLPETALTEGILENNFSDNASIKHIRNWLQAHPKLQVLTGATTYLSYPDEKQKTITSRYSASGNTWYDIFNTALLINLGDSVQVYHKSKLVPGVEKMPYPQVLGFLESLAIQLGGSSGSLGSQKEAGVLQTPWGAVAPVICYESVYGNYVSDYINKDAQLICIITNDGWWGNTDGYRQHCAYASLRAIENRRYVARSANTGISCFVDPLGNQLQQTAWWEEAAIKQTLQLNTGKTFYNRLGDWPGWLMLSAFAAMLLAAIIGRKQTPSTI